jgi:hypothetical protein
VRAQAATTVVAGAELEAAQANVSFRGAGTGVAVRP